MANSFHSLTIVGNLGRDPELRYTPSGQPVCTMSVATTRVFNNAQDEKQEETTWFRITVWGKMAETCNNYLKKGNKVAVIGRMNPDKSGNPRIWDKQDGTKGASFEVTAEQVHFLSGGNGGSQAAEEAGGEEIPF